jgi:vesicle transport through interaction with t-SNAREs protein 1
MEDLAALFHQYETDYCNKSTDISRKISALASITGGVVGGWMGLDGR